MRGGVALGSVSEPCTSFISRNVRNTRSTRTCHAMPTVSEGAWA
jgi:hypothetical protein